MMKSIRARLLVTLIGAVLATGAVAGWFIYRNALRAADAFFDEHLRQTAMSLRDQAFEYAAPPVEEPDAEFDFVIQVWSATGVRVYLSRPHTALPGLVTLGFSSVEVGGLQWRVFAVQARSYVIQVAQPSRVRSRQAARLALQTLEPFLLAMPLLAILVWLAVGRSLRPLDALAKSVREREPSSLSALPDTGLPVEVQPVVSALNELLQRLRAAIDHERRFLDDAAHELRTPLTALSLQVQALQRADEQERPAALDSVRAGVARATRLVEQLLALARQQPKAASTAVPVSLVDIARAVIGDLAPLADASGIDLGLAQADPTQVRGDPDSLATLLRNLVDNALRYTPRGGRVDVAVLASPVPALVVSDTGPGIPVAERARAFDRFHRLPGSSGVGSGLGLSIVKAIADASGASVTLDDAPGGGLKVSVRFEGRS
jgi:two-component system OmpR family sensor kinase